MAKKIWKFRDDILGYYVNIVSNKTFQDAEDRLNALEEKEQLPDMHKKIEEYILELDTEIDRCCELAKEALARNSETVEQQMKDKLEVERMLTRSEALIEVRNDLQSRLDELI